MSKTIIPPKGVYGFDFKPTAQSLFSPTTLIGKHICSLKCFEKENILIKKLLERIRKPSTKEACELNNSFDIIVNDGFCELSNKETNFKTEVFNLGTPATPAFFYGRFIFVFDPEKRAFYPIDLRVLFFNNNYALIILPGNIIVKYDIKGVSGLGNFLSLTAVPDGYILATDIGFEKQAVYALTRHFQKLFETNDFSKFNISSIDGIVTHEYANSTSYALDQYVPTKSGYKLE